MEFHLSAQGCAAFDILAKQNYDMVGKFILYPTEAVPQDVVTKLCSEAKLESIVTESEIDAEVFVPVLPCHAQRDVQAAFDEHIQNMTKFSTERDDSACLEWSIWPFGLVIADELERPLVILMRQERNRWMISHCRIPFEALDRLDGINYDATTEDEIIEDYDGVLGTGGPPPDWKYQFALFSTGMDYPSDVIHRQIDSVSATYPPEEEAIVMMTNVRENKNHRVSWEQAVEMFPNFCRRPLVDCDGEPSPVQRHPHLFLCIDTPTPVMGPLKDVLICNMIWDGNTDRSEDELKAMGRTSEVVKTRCRHEEALETIRRTADDLDRASEA